MLDEIFGDLNISLNFFYLILKGEGFEMLDEIFGDLSISLKFFYLILKGEGFWNVR